MSGYSYGRGTASQFGGGGVRGQASYPTNANASAARPSSEHSYGAMAYPHIPSINESSEFGGNYSDPHNSYQKQSHNPSQRMNSNMLGGDNRNFPAPNMDASAYNRHSNTGMQSGYGTMSGSTPNRRASVPPNVGIGSFSNMQRSHSYSGSSTDSAYSNRNASMTQSSYPQPNMSNQSQQYGEGFGPYASHHNQPAAYNRTNAMMKSSEMWDRTSQTRMGQAPYPNPHPVNMHLPHKANSNQYHQTQFPSSQTQRQSTNSQLYAANNTPGMHSSDMNMTVAGDGSVSSDLGIRGNQCVNPGAMMGQAYGNNQAMYGSSVGARMRVPNQRSSMSRGGMYNSMTGGNQVPGSLQKLRHYGPMPNSSSGYSRTSTRPGNMQNNVGTVRNTAGSASNTMGMQGVWQANSGSQSGYAQYSQNQPNVSTNVPFNGLPQNSNMQMQQPMNYPNNMGMSNQQQQQAQNQRNFSGSVPSNAGMESLSAPSGMYGQSTTPNTGSAPYPSAGCTDKVDSSSAEFPSNISAAETEAMIQQLNQDRIFSAELEKLARLSRNPTADDFIADPAVATPVTGTGEPTKSSCSGSNTFQSTSIDELLDGGTCVASSVSEKPSCVANSNVNLSHANSHLQSPSTSVSGSFQSGSGAVMNQNQPDQIASSSSSAPHTPNSTSNVGKPAQNQNKGHASDKNSESDTNQGQASESNENSVQHLQRMTQSIKDTSKQDDLMKVANSQHAEYLSHSSSDNYGSQNCIAALSAACRNIIADMDSSMPKQNSGQKVQSPLGKNTKFDGSSGFGTKSDALSGFGSGPPSVNSMGDQFVAPNSCMMTAPPNCMPMDSYAAFPNNFNGANPMAMPDFQGKYHDFLEQNLPMQMAGRRIDEKPRKGRRRRKSEEFSTEQLISCSMPPVKPKRKYRKRSTQNPPSVESMEGPLSVDNVVFTPLSESGSHQADDMGYRSATQTPNSAPNSWGMDVKMSCSDSISMAMSIADGNQMEHVSQDLLDSVFSPDTTMSSTTNQEMPESGNCVPQGSSPIMHNQSPLGHHHLNNNHPIGADHKHNMYPPQSNNIGSSTGEANCQFISTSTHSVNGNVKQKDVEEAHPLEILQAQIKIQRKQFNLGESQQQSQGAKNTEKISKVENALPSDLEMDNLLSSEETSWYLSEDQPKDQGGGGLWEDLCPKGQTNTSSKPLLLAMQS
nr:uncharacterized protein F59B2.12-like [Lytechinus pictus]